MSTAGEAQARRARRRAIARGRPSTARFAVRFAEADERGVEGKYREGSSEPVASPCISVCVMDASGGLCIGCFRTLDEIAAWSVLDAGAKRAVLAALPARRARSASNDR